MGGGFLSRKLNALVSALDRKPHKSQIAATFARKAWSVTVRRDSHSAFSGAGFDLAGP
jgi:hypothetical protein